MKKYPLFFLTLLIISNPLYAEIVNGIACKVGSSIITINEFNKTYDTESQKALSSGTKVPAKREVMDRLVDNLIIEIEADKKKIVVAEDEVQMIIENIKKQNNLSDQDFKKELEKEHITLEELKEQYRLDLMKSRLATQLISGKVNKITDDEIKSFYEDPSNKQFFNVPALVKLSQIYLPVPEDASFKDVKDIKNRGIELYERAQAGEIFQELVKSYSMAPNKNENLGYLGSFTQEQLLSFMNLQDVQLIFSLYKGDITPPLRLGDGYYIFKIEDKRERKSLSLAEAYENIKSYLLRKKGDELFSAWLLEKRSSTPIRYMIDLE